MSKFVPVTREQLQENMGEIQVQLCSQITAGKAGRWLLCFCNPFNKSVRYEVHVDGRVTPYVNLDAAIADYNYGNKGVVDFGSNPSPEQIQEAFLDVMNGTSAHDIRGNTGLPEERCQEIYKIYSDLSNK